MWCLPFSINGKFLFTFPVCNYILSLRWNYTKIRIYAPIYRILCVFRFPDVDNQLFNNNLT